MSYVYEEQKKEIFTEDGQVLFLKIRDKAKNLISNSGAATMGKIISGMLGNSWDMLACVDRMVELGELREIKQVGVAGQDRIFVKGMNN